jgi:hypothetical protein
LFNDAETYYELIELIAKQRYGIERSDLIKQSKLSSGGRLNQKLIELEEAGFIISFKPYGHIKRGSYYKMIDEYSLFYLNWIKPAESSIRHQSNPRGYWEGKSMLPAWKSWSGYSFESVCYKHIENIRLALHIPVTASIGAWRYAPQKNPNKNGAQIDLLFDRDDGVVTVCEIKYADTLFEINKAYFNNLRNKIDVYKEQGGVSKQIFMAMITCSGIKKNKYSDELLSGQAMLSDLFS